MALDRALIFPLRSRHFNRSDISSGTISSIICSNKILDLCFSPSPPSVSMMDRKSVDADWQQIKRLPCNRQNKSVKSLFNNSQFLLFCSISFFKNWAIPGLFFPIFRLFNTQLTIYNNCSILIHFC